MGYYGRGFKPYKSAAEERAQIEKGRAKLMKKNKDIQPVIIAGTKIAKNWWGLAWNKNLESYADYSNRISRGKKYVRYGAVLDLKIERGKVSALVQGSRAKPYEVLVEIDSLPKKKWEAILKDHKHSIESMEALAEGSFPKELEEVFFMKGEGLFPGPGGIHFMCSCPDSAYMCKHVAAVLYGVGARFDVDPLLLFTLRDIEIKDIIKKSVDQKMDDMLKNADKKSKREIRDGDLMKLFGLDGE